MKNMLKIKRWEAELKQYELAFLLGCSATYLSMVENNRVEATQEFKRKAAEVFGVPVDELFAAPDMPHPGELKKKRD
jgi:transcriptional regulator with XRE-family HTH domain